MEVHQQKKQKPWRESTLVDTGEDTLTGGASSA